MTESKPVSGKSLEDENLALKHKIDELERALSDVELNQHKDEPNGQASQWLAKVLFLLTITAGLLPAYFVIRDRWLHQPISIKSVDELWWNILFLRNLAYPRYFFIVFGCMLFTLMVVLIWRKSPNLLFSNLSLARVESAQVTVDPQQQRAGYLLFLTALLIADISALFMVFTQWLPGWELLLALILFVTGLILMDYPLAEIKHNLQSQWRFLLSAGLLIIAICGALYALFGENRPNYIFYLLLVLAALNFLQYYKIASPIFWISIASLVALTWKINGWEYVVIGDEYGFYNEVRNILENRTPWQLLNNTFNGTLVYGTHPYFSSYIQNFFMKLFDNHNFGWRFSNPFLVACSLFLFYYFFKAFLPRRTALITVALLGTSHYLLSFSKIGYNNLQALFAMGLILAAFTWALKSTRRSAFAMAGLTIGLCFYVYPAALYLIPLPLIGLLLFYPPTNKKAFVNWIYLIAATALLFYPLTSQPKYWDAKIPGTFLISDSFNESSGLASNIGHNLLYSALSFLYAPEQTHYVSTGYMDPVSSAFILMGFAYLLKSIGKRNKSAIFIFASFLIMFVLVGATHGRNFPTATRMFLLLPWFALFAAFGLEWCADKAEALFKTQRSSLLKLAVAAIVLLNLYQTYTIDIRNMSQYHSLPSMFIKTVRMIEANSQVPPKSYVFVAPPPWNTSGLEIIQRVYLIPDSPRQLINLPLEENLLPASAFDLVAQRDNIIIVKQDMDANLISQIDAQLQGWGKVMCEIKNDNNVPQFQLWHSGDLGWLCK